MGKTMIPPPVMLSLMICDQVITDAKTQKNSLIGIFENLGAFKFPTRHPKFTLFAQFTNGRGTVDLSVRIVHLRDDENELFSTHGPLGFSDIREVKSFVFEVNGFKFPEPGEYRIQVFSNGEILGERRIACRIIEKPNEDKE